MIISCLGIKCKQVDALLMRLAIESAALVLSSLSSFAPLNRCLLIYTAIVFIVNGDVCMHSG